jgi:SnoaL-like domain
MSTAVAAHQAISVLHATYADIATRREWDELAAIIAPDATLTFDVGGGEPLSFTGPDELGAFGAQATSRFGFFCYQPLNLRLHRIDQERAAGRFYVLETMTDRESGAWMDFYGVYEDEYVFDRGTWWFASRAFRTLARRPGDHARG